MPDAPLRPCASGPSCPNRVKRGRCPDCTQKQGRSRRTARTLRYDERWWRAFRRHYIDLLVLAGVAPVCGAHLPGGPAPTVSQCHAEGIITGTSTRGSLHLHHEPPLTEAEQHDRAAVCDPMRIVLACDSCHNQTTGQRDRMAGYRGGPVRGGG